MNKQLFIGKNIAQNSKSNSQLLADGEFGIFGINAATYIEEKVASPNIYERIFIGKGTTTVGYPKISRAIDILPKNKNFEYKKFLYSPAVSKLYLVSTDCTGKSAYDDFSLKISSRFGQDFSGAEKDYKTYHATGKFLTPRAVYDAWAVQVGNDPYATVNVTATDAGLEVSGKTWDYVIDVAVDYADNPVSAICRTCSDCSSTVQTMNEGDSGSGTYWHLKKLALEASAYIGMEFSNDRLMVSPGSALDAEVLALGNADLIYIKYSNRNQPSGDHGQVFDVYQELFLAVPTGTDTAGLEAVLNYVLNTTIKTALAS